MAQNILPGEKIEQILEHLKTADVEWKAVPMEGVFVGHEPFETKIAEYVLHVYSEGSVVVFRPQGTQLVKIFETTSPTAKTVHTRARASAMNADKAIEDILAYLSRE